MASGPAGPLDHPSGVLRLRFFGQNMRRIYLCRHHAFVECVTRVEGHHRVGVIRVIDRDIIASSCPGNEQVYRTKDPPSAPLKSLRDSPTSMNTTAVTEPWLESEWTTGPMSSTTTHVKVVGLI